MALALWTGLLLGTAGCKTAPVSDIEITPRSSMLAVDVVFPALIREPALVQVYLVRGPVHAGLQTLPELVPSTFVKWSRAYWLDPAPGTYSVVAVTAAYAPPWNQAPIAGVSKTRYSGTSADAIVFPTALIHETRTTVAPGRVAFMGTLQVARRERVGAKARYEDDLQRRLAERLRPGSTEASRISGWLNRAWLPDLAKTVHHNDLADRQAFLEAAIHDLHPSPWMGSASALICPANRVSVTL